MPLPGFPEIDRIDRQPCACVAATYSFATTLKWPLVMETGKGEDKKRRPMGRAAKAADLELYYDECDKCASLYVLFIKDTDKVAITIKSTVMMTRSTALTHYYLPMKTVKQILTGYKCNR